VKALIKKTDMPGSIDRQRGVVEKFDEQQKLTRLALWYDPTSCGIHCKHRTQRTASTDL